MARGSRSNKRPDKGRSSGRRSGNGGGRSRRPPTNRQFPRTARLNSLLHEIVADFFERVDDDRFHLVTIVGVEVDSDLNRARVFISDPDLTSSMTEGGVADDDLLAALGEYRKPVQAKIGRETRMRKTPEVVFEIDPGVRSGARIDAILSTLETSEVDNPGPESESESDSGHGGAGGGYGDASSSGSDY